MRRSFPLPLPLSPRRDSAYAVVPYDERAARYLIIAGGGLACRPAASRAAGPLTVKLINISRPRLTRAILGRVELGVRDGTGDSAEIDRRVSPSSCISLGGRPRPVAPWRGATRRERTRYRVRYSIWRDAR